MPENKTEETQTPPLDQMRNESLSQQLPESAESPQEAPAQDVEVKDNLDFNPLSPGSLRRDLEIQSEDIAKVAQGVEKATQLIMGIRTEMIQAFGRLQAYLGNLENVAHNHNVRVNVIETLLCHPEFEEERKRFVSIALGELMKELGEDGKPSDLIEKYKPLDLIEDLHRIAEKHVVPVLQEQQKKRQEEFEERQKEAQAAAQEMQEGTETQEHDQQPGGLLGPDGRSMSRTVMEED